MRERADGCSSGAPPLALFCQAVQEASVRCEVRESLFHWTRDLLCGSAAYPCLIFVGQGPVCAVYLRAASAYAAGIHVLHDEGSPVTAQYLFGPCLILSDLLACFAPPCLTLRFCSVII